MDRSAINPFFVKQMAMYSAYHRTIRNRLTHVIGIPAIVFAIFIPLHRIVLLELWSGEAAISLATALWFAVGGFYLWLDRTIGGIMVLVAFVLMLAAEQVTLLDGRVAWTVFGICFVGGWILQLVGHVFEGRRPALADNLLQALIGPMFLVAEGVFAAGLRRDLHEAVEARWKEFAATAA